MNIEFYCSQCGQFLTIDPKHAGAHVQCPKCKAELKVPEATPECEGLEQSDGQGVGEKDYTELKKQLMTPTFLPCDFDVTVPGWLARLEVWGRLKYVYVNPYTKRKESITKNAMVNQMENVSLFKMVGEWEFAEEPGYTVSASREYTDVDDKKYVEKYLITVDLRPELKKELSPKWRFWK
ncbi:hypothetical protein ES702_04269 [subsurface metagenome]